VYLVFLALQDVLRDLSLLPDIRLGRQHLLGLLVCLACLVFQDLRACLVCLDLPVLLACLVFQECLVYLTERKYYCVVINAVVLI
jgi:hypothetical protein